MKYLNIGVFLLIILTPLFLHAQDVSIHHILKVTLSPGEHRLVVLDTITLSGDFPDDAPFSLHAGLLPSPITPDVSIMKIAETHGTSPLESFMIKLPHGLRTFSLAYDGNIYQPLEQRAGKQAEAIQETKDVITSEGVVLSAASSWYPVFGNGLLTFDLEVILPPYWDAVSQGERTLHERSVNTTHVRWNSTEPQNEIFIIAARFSGYIRSAGLVQTMIFLRTPDGPMAGRYLDAAAGYLDMYSALIGPYPYKKFALVENFRETGFGMPSFTLLGSKVIRLPFIINSSYPHEILHNWWGNSVFPDYAQGNWSEGLTAYLADHLIKEQQGAGAEYRINTLQKYADYVLADRDFPLTRFSSRHSSSSEAIGYGKALMFFHMLRRDLGDDAFKKGIREFYKRNIFRFASFSDIRVSLEAITGKDLKPDFEQWVIRTGAPKIELNNARAGKYDSNFTVSIVITQVQPGEAYFLRIPIAVTMDGQDRAYQTVGVMKDKRMELKLLLPSRPLRIDIDPEFDIFRRLDIEEIPPAVSQALGAKKMLVILPSTADNKLLKAYKNLVRDIGGSGPDELEVKLDSAIDKLPHDRAIAIIGWENRFLTEITSSASEYGVAFAKKSVRIDRTDIQKKNHAFVLSARVPGNKGLAMLFIASDLIETLPGLGRKIPHYSKYSYLAFEGREAVNVAKGRWPVFNSPLTVFVPNEDGSIIRVDMAKLAPHEPLAAYAPIFTGNK